MLDLPRLLRAYGLHSIAEMTEGAPFSGDRNGDPVTSDSSVFGQVWRGQNPPADPQIGDVWFDTGSLLFFVFLWTEIGKYEFWISLFLLKGINLLDASYRPNEKAFHRESYSDGFDLAGRTGYNQGYEEYRVLSEHLKTRGTAGEIGGAWEWTRTEDFQEGHKMIVNGDAESTRSDLVEDRNIFIRPAITNLVGIVD